MATTTDRKKVNFMVDRRIVLKIENLVPAGKRSDFVNEALDNALISYARRRAFEGMDDLAGEIAKAGLSLSTEEFIKLKNYGRG